MNSNIERNNKSRKLLPGKRDNFLMFDAVSAIVMETSVIRIGIVDRQRVFLDALAYRLSGEPRLNVVCTSESADDALAKILLHAPAVVVIDADLPQGSAMDLAAEIRRRHEAARLIFLTENPTDAVIEQALRLDVSGILSRDEPLDRLVLGMTQAAAGQTAFSRSIDTRLDFDPKRNRFVLRTTQPLRGLTDRQLEILRHLARGESVKDVARKLYLSPKSVDNQKFRIMNKIGVRDKVSLALYAVREGLIEP